MNKLQRVSGMIYADISSGRIPPGSKLPTFYELEKEHDVSRRTINSCIKLLKCKGLVTSRERDGIFVAEKPAVLNRFALVFPKEALAVNRYMQTIIKVIDEEALKRNVKFEIFSDFEPHTDNPDYRKLICEIHKMRIGGIAHIFMAPLPDESELLHFPGIPVINTSSYTSIDDKAYADKSCDYLLSKNRRRIAVFYWTGNFYHRRFIEKRNNSLMETPDHWFINSNPEGIESIVRILLDFPKGKRPNGFIITDDNLVDPALKGVFLSRVNVPEELEIVTHCNWPNPVASVIPVKRLGFDTRKTVSLIIDNLLKSKGRSGYQALRSEPLVPLFEEELQ